MNHPKNNLRVVSLVPSWTETLVQCGVNVVGRTRFCIHPRDKMADIPVVGGTKQVNWEKIETLKPDILIFDKEENTFEMAAASPYPYLATHVCHLEDVSHECLKLANQFENLKLAALSTRWRELSQKPALSFDPENIPGFLQWVKPTTHMQTIERVSYIIWRDPWMSVSPTCFIGSVINKLGMVLPQYVSNERYPKFDLSELNPQTTLLLLSSEPYPFHRKTPEIANFPFASAVVDGECYSWFGLRSLLFLEKQYHHTLWTA